MFDLIKKLVNEGFEVKIIDVKSPSLKVFESKKFDMPEPSDFKIEKITVNPIESETVENKEPKEKIKRGRKSKKGILDIAIEQHESKKKEFIDRIKKRAKRRRDPNTLHWKIQNKVRDLKGEGYGVEEIAEELNVPSEAVEKYFNE